MDVHGCGEDIVRLSSTNCCERATADLVECAVVDQMGAATVTLN